MKAILTALALTFAGVAVTGVLVHQDTALDVLTPEPARVVQSFIGALAARRPVSAEQYLAESVRTPAAITRLHELASEHRRFEDASTERAGETARVRARLRAASSPDSREFDLARDPQSRLWKITRFD
jgi:hypothetical protein